MKYDELVKALRRLHETQDCNECEAGNIGGWCDESACVFLDAAAAIEELQAEVEKHRAAWAKLAKDIDYTVTYGHKPNEPKLGEWIESEEMEWGIYPFKKKTCSVCDCKIDHTFMLACMDYFDDRDTVFHYCPNCGAKMEVQE